MIWTIFTPFIAVFKSYIKPGVEFAHKKYSFIDGPINYLKDMIKQQLNNELGKIIMIQKVGNYLHHAYKIIKNHNNYTNEYLFDVFTKYELYEESEGFVF